ncbi:MAG: tetratricopeptide repeat protein [Proteobacteria bacterium]|nr:tetratricopeptide repeat protein [Pseudomonadota bacterium]
MHANAAPSQSQDYQSCLNRTRSDPGGALAQANGWSRNGGGPPADHCAALALVGLKRYGEAAVKLDALARSEFAAKNNMRAALFDQAGNAWMLAQRPDSAIASFSAALAIDAFDADYLADRARALAQKQNWAKAEADLTAALLVSPGRADLYVLRGSARHALGRKGEARADFDLALKIQPNNPDALLERGNGKYENGDIAGARADWQASVNANPNSDAAATARQHLADTAAP